MFHMSTSRPAEIAGTIRFRKRPYGLGLHTDADGNRWHIRAIVNDCVCAEPADEVQPYYTSTAGNGYGLVSQTWRPWKVEVVEDGA